MRKAILLSSAQSAPDGMHSMSGATGALPRRCTPDGTAPF